jgi:hypothetical protein
MDRMARSISGGGQNNTDTAAALGDVALDGRKLNPDGARRELRTAVIFQNQSVGRIVLPPDDWRGGPPANLYPAWAIRWSMRTVTDFTDLFRRTGGRR